MPTVAGTFGMAHVISPFAALQIGGALYRILAHLRDRSAARAVDVAVGPAHLASGNSAVGKVVRWVSSTNRCSGQVRPQAFQSTCAPVWSRR